MDTKQISFLVATITAVVNVILFTSGFTTTVSCTVARAWSTAYAAATSTE